MFFNTWLELTSFEIPDDVTFYCPVGEFSRALALLNTTLAQEPETENKLSFDIKIVFINNLYFKHILR